MLFVKIKGKYLCEIRIKRAQRSILLLPRDLDGSKI
jgi:hypothetical protein